MNTTGMLLACGRALIASLVLTPIARDIFRSYNVVDRPGRRKVHAYPIPRVGGIPIAVAFFFALDSLRGRGGIFQTHWLQKILSGAAIIFLTGLIDDFADLQPAVKLLGQIVAAVVAYYSGIQIDHLGGLALPVWAGLPLTVFWLLLTTNALNLIDGLDGLCGGVALWASLSFFAAALLSGDMGLAYTVLALAGALLGFLFFNFNPATVFLGDSGALLIGFMLGTVSIVWGGGRLTPFTVVFALFVLCVPMMDLGLSILRRSLKGQALFSADRGHVHHRLLDRGLTVRQASVTLYAAGITGGLYALILSWLAAKGDGLWYGAATAIVLISAIGTAVAGVRFLRYPEFGVAGSLVFRGEFRKVFAQKLRMQRLAEDLARTHSAEEWWAQLSAAARAEDWIRLRWVGCDTPRDERLADRKAAWSLAIELDSAQSIVVEGDHESARRSCDPTAFSEVLSRSFMARRNEWTRLAIP